MADEIEFMENYKTHVASAVIMMKVHLAFLPDQLHVCAVHSDTLTSWDTACFSHSMHFAQHALHTTPSCPSVCFAVCSIVTQPLRSNGDRRNVIMQRHH